MKRISKCALLLLVLLIGACMVACSAPESEAVSDNRVEDMVFVVGSSDPNRKVVYTVSMELESDNISALKSTISQKNTELGGYVETNNELYTDGDCTYVRVVYRVPTEKLDVFTAFVERQGGLESKDVSTVDITTSYVDAEAQKSALTERKTLLEGLLQDPEISAGDRISIIDEISQVNTELQSIELMINGYESDVGYSTVIIMIDEAPTVLDIIMPVVVLFIFYVLPPIIVLICVFAARRRRRRAAEQ